MKNNVNAISVMFNTSYAMPKNLDVLRSKEEAVAEKFAILETLHKAGNATVDAMKSAEDEVKNAIKLLNIAIVEQWCEEMKSATKEEAMTAYTDNAGELGGFRLKNPSKGEESSSYEIVSTLRYVPYATVNKHLNLASGTTYGVKLGQFAHNVAKYLCSKENGVGANVPKFYGTKATKEETPLFCKYAKTDLKHQMDVIAKELRPEGMEEIHFQSHDVNFILYAVTKATSGASATLQMLDEKAFLRLIVTAMHFRLAGKEYNFQSKAKVHAEPKAK